MEIIAVFLVLLAFIIYWILSVIPLTLRLIMLAVIGFALAFVTHSSNPALGAVLVILALVFIPTKPLRLIFFAIVCFALASANTLDADPLEIFFWLGMAFGFLNLGLFPAPWMGYDGFFLYSWLEEVCEDEGDGGDGGDGGGD